MDEVSEPLEWDSLQLQDDFAGAIVKSSLKGGEVI